MSELTRLKRHKTIPFLNISTTEAEDWARIGKSTVFDLVLNAQTEENDFIDSEMKTTDITSYKPELSQELQSNKGDAAFDYLYDMFFNLPTWEDVKKNLLIVFDGNQGTEEAPKFRAWNTKSTLILDHFDSVAEKIYFKFNVNSIVRGTATVTAGKPTFTAS
ncbi:MAG: hypothetical protein SPK58_09775 [Lachnospiraceae bacterium]|nr:hypothetical protein [Lachnospiraceae bacterium]